MKQFKSLIVFTVLSAAGPLLTGQVTFNPVPSRAFGQPNLANTTLAPNLIEGRELNDPQAVAIDTAANPNVVYVADTLNNRVLVWKNAASLTKGNFADLVIGQRDFLTNTAKGPGTDLSSGLFSPVALAVDASGNLYVVDAGNNRVVRYATPTQQTGQLFPIDLVIGQKDVNAGRSANEGNQTPNERTLSFSANGTARSGLAFDTSGNLWVSDPGNNRVLRFPKSSLSTNEPSADLVLGQNDFTTGTTAPNINIQTRTSLVQPSGLGFDPQNRLFVADGFNRVLVFFPPFSLGKPASRILGVLPVPAGQPAPTRPVINDQTLGNADSSNRLLPPEGVFFVGNNPFVVDTGNNRIVKYDPVDQFPPESTQFSPSARDVTGQPSLFVGQPNQGRTEPGADTFNGPVSAAVASNGDLFVADAGNNRVLIFPQLSGVSYKTAKGVLGQLDFAFNTTNLIEGRELALYFGTVNIGGATVVQGGGAIAVDYNSTPPHLYLSDPVNNRILGFNDYRRVHTGDRADIVIGQPDFFRSVVNYPNGQVNDSGLSFPEGLIVDANGNLFVADQGNARVLRFPSPFNVQSGAPQRANLVIGQANFSTKFTDASSSTMRAPYGVALTNAGDLLVSDQLLNRVLFFRKPSGDFNNGQAAESVIGQPTFSSNGNSSSDNLNSPHLIATDRDDRLYVADTGNNRVVIYRNIPSAGNNPNAIFSLTGFNGPHGVFVSKTNGEVLVADTFGNRVVRYPTFDQLVLNPTPNTTVPVFGPLSVAEDVIGNLLVGDAQNRVAFYFPTLFVENAANYFQRITPGMIAVLFPTVGSRFGRETATSSVVPLGTTLGDVQVTVNGVLAPLFYADANQINIQIPNGTPLGPQEFQVLRASTGEVLSSGLFRVDASSPGLFTVNQQGTGQVLAINARDNSINNAVHPVKPGEFITLYGTGSGFVSGAPNDGTPVSGIVRTDTLPRVIVNAEFVPDGDIQFSGLAPGFVGLWQINIKIPADIPPGDVQVIVFGKDGSTSNIDLSGRRIVATIRVNP